MTLQVELYKLIFLHSLSVPSRTKTFHNVIKFPTQGGTVNYSCSTWLPLLRFTKKVRDTVVTKMLASSADSRNLGSHPKLHLYTALFYGNNCCWSAILLPHIITSLPFIQSVKLWREQQLSVLKFHVESTSPFVLILPSKMCECAAHRCLSSPKLDSVIESVDDPVLFPSKLRKQNIQLLRKSRFIQVIGSRGAARVHMLLLDCFAWVCQTSFWTNSWERTAQPMQLWNRRKTVNRSAWVLCT